jgi:cation transport ATPase
VTDALDAITSWEFLRWVNMIGAVLVVTLLIAGTMKRWAVMPGRYKRMAPWVIATYVVIAYGSGEALATEVRPGYRIVMMTCVLLGLILALLYGLDDTELDDEGVWYLPWRKHHRG